MANSENSLDMTAMLRALGMNEQDDSHVPDDLNERIGLELRDNALHHPAIARGILKRVNNVHDNTFVAMDMGALGYDPDIFDTENYPNEAIPADEVRKLLTLAFIFGGSSMVDLLSKVSDHVREKPAREASETMYRVIAATHNELVEAVRTQRPRFYPDANFDTESTDADAPTKGPGNE